MTDKYQGFTNYETWAVNLWLNNEEGVYHEIRDLAESYIDRPYELGQEIKEKVEEGTEDILGKFNAQGREPYEGMISDIFHANLSVVNWEEIAEGFLEK